MNQKRLALIILIVIVMIIVIYIVHLFRIKNEEKKGGTVFVQGTYNITIGEKTPLNPNYSRGGPRCFYLNNIEAPTLVLKRELYYEFNNKSSEPIYFSTSPVGGPGAPGSVSKNQSSNFVGLADGTIFFRVTEDLPETFYYQSGLTSYMGGKINTTAA